MVEGWLHRDTAVMDKLGWSISTSLVITSFAVKMDLKDWRGKPGAARMIRAGAGRAALRCRCPAELGEKAKNLVAVVAGTRLHRELLAVFEPEWIVC